MTTQNFSKRQYQILIPETTSMPEESLNICDGKHLLYSPDYNINFSFSQLMSSIVTQCFEELLDLHGVFLTLYSHS